MLSKIPLIERCKSKEKWKLGCPWFIDFYEEPQCHFNRLRKHHFNDGIGVLIKDLTGCPRNRRKEV